VEEAEAMHLTGFKFHVTIHATEARGSGGGDHHTPRSLPSSHVRAANKVPKKNKLKKDAIFTKLSAKQQ
jgi:hypothetical protein